MGWPIWVIPVWWYLDLWNQTWSFMKLFRFEVSYLISTTRPFNKQKIQYLKNHLPYTQYVLLDDFLSGNWWVDIHLPRRPILYKITNLLHVMNLNWRTNCKMRYIVKWFSIINSCLWYFKWKLVPAIHGFIFCFWFLIGCQFWSIWNLPNTKLIFKKIFKEFSKK